MQSPLERGREQLLQLALEKAGAPLSLSELRDLLPRAAVDAAIEKLKTSPTEQLTPDQVGAILVIVQPGKSVRIELAGFSAAGLEKGSDHALTVQRNEDTAVTDKDAADFSPAQAAPAALVGMVELTHAAFPLTVDSVSQPYEQTFSFSDANQQKHSLPLFLAAPTELQMPNAVVIITRYPTDALTVSTSTHLRQPKGTAFVGDGLPAWEFPVPSPVVAPPYEPPSVPKAASETPAQDEGAPTPEKPKRRFQIPILDRMLGISTTDQPNSTPEPTPPAPVRPPVAETPGTPARGFEELDFVEDDDLTTAPEATPVIPAPQPVTEITPKPAPAEAPTETNLKIFRENALPLDARRAYNQVLYMIGINQDRAYFDDNNLPSTSGVPELALIGTLTETFSGVLEAGYEDKLRQQFMRRALLAVQEHFAKHVNTSTDFANNEWLLGLASPLTTALRAIIEEFPPAALNPRYGEVMLPTLFAKATQEITDCIRNYSELRKKATPAEKPLVVSPEIAAQIEAVRDQLAGLQTKLTALLEQHAALTTAKTGAFDQAKKALLDEIGQTKNRYELLVAQVIDKGAEKNWFVAKRAIDEKYSSIVDELRTLEQTVSRLGYNVFALQRKEQGTSQQ